MVHISILMDPHTLNFIVYKLLYTMLIHENILLQNLPNFVTITNLKMMILLVIVLSVIVAILIHGHQGKRARLPPGPQGLPLIGNLHQLHGVRDLHLYLWRLANEHGPLVHMKLGSVTAIVVSSVKLAEELFKTKDLSFVNRPKCLGQQRLSYHGLDITFSQYGSYWRGLRKIVAIHLFSVRKIQSFRPIREEEVSRLVKSLTDSLRVGEVVNLSEVAMDLSNAMICRMAFGKRSGMERLNELLHEVGLMMCTPFVSDFFPFLGWVDRLTGLLDKLESTFLKFDTFYQELIDEHLDSRKEKHPNEDDDLLDVLIRLREDDSCTIDLSRDSIKALLFDIFVAGTDTIAAAVVWTMMALMKSPSIMTKLQKEIRETTTGKSQVDEDDLQKLPYLKAVISESLRLYPPAPLLVPRETTEKCTLGGYEIQPKTIVYINGWAIARDPEHWDNPNDFVPERFLHSNISIKGNDLGAIPFGSGRRMCPGMSMALIIVELTVANLVCSFDWEFPSGISSKDINEDVSLNLTMHKKDPLLFVPKKIS